MSKQNRRKGFDELLARREELGDVSPPWADVEASSDPEPIDGKIVSSTDLDNKFVVEIDGNSSLEEIENRITTIHRQFYGELGVLLGYIRDGKKWEPSGYKSWPEYLRIRWNWTASYGNRLILIGPVIQGLAQYSDKEISAGQGHAIAPVWYDVSHDAAIEVWKATPGRKSAAALEKTAIDLGYLQPNTTKESKNTSSSLWKRYDDALTVLDDEDGLRNLAQDAPEKGFAVAYKLFKVASEIKNDLPEELRAKLEGELEGEPAED
ncbi:hypothetical protein ACIBQX_48885 [Nonomuraea sp. NPDC049714]|uniref:hypothetical protein n=1 Tax=Nonomuraea sp. NPDC049714 TaxID=3364357 RepID=UPI0037A2E811